MEQEYEKTILKLTVEDIKKSRNNSRSSFRRRRRNQTQPYDESIPETNGFMVYGIPFLEFVQIATKLNRYDLLVAIAHLDDDNLIDKRNLVEHLTLVPKDYTSDREIIDYLFSKGRFDMALQCYLNEEDCHKYALELKKVAPQVLTRMIKENVKQIFYNDFIFEEILKSNNLQLLNNLVAHGVKFTPGFERIIADYKEKLYEFVKNNKARLSYISYYLLLSPTLFNYVKSLNDIETLCKFHPSLLGQDFIDANALAIVKSETIFFNLIKSKNYYSNKSFLICALENGYYEYLNDFSNDLFTDDICEKYYDIIIKYCKPFCYSHSSYMFFRLFKENPYNPILTDFSIEVYTDDFLKENFDKILEVIEKNNIFSSSHYLLNECLKRKCSKDIILSFSKSAVDDDVIRDNLSYIIEILRQCKGKFYKMFNCSDAFLTSEIVLKKVLEEGDKELLKSFYAPVSEEFVKENLTLIMNAITDRLPGAFDKSKILFDEYLKQGKFNILFKFNLSFFTEEFIRDNKEKIMENIFDSLPSVLSSSKILFDEYVKRGNFSILSQFSPAFLSEDFVKEHTKEIMDSITDQMPYFFNTSQILFNEYLKQGNFKMLLWFDSSLFTDEVVRDNLENIMNNITSYLPLEFSKLEILFDEYLKQGNFKILFQFDPSFFTEEFIKDNLEKIKNYLTDSIPYVLKKSQILFNEYLKDNNSKLLFEFDPSFFSEDFIKANLEAIKNNIKTFLPYALKDSKVLFNEYLKDNNFPILIQFNDKFFTEDFIKTNLEIIKSNIKRSLPKPFKKSNVLFNEYLRQNNFPILFQFNVSFFTEKFISEHLEEIMNNISNSLPLGLNKSRLLFNEYLKQNNFPILLKFDSSFFTEKFISEHLETIKNNITDKLPYTLSNSKILFNEYLKDDNFPILLQFNFSFFTEDFIQANIEKIKNYITDSIHESFRNSRILFSEYLKEGKFDLLFQFSTSFFKEEFITNNLDNIFNSINDKVPYVLKLSPGFLQAVVDRNRNELLMQMDESLFTMEVIRKNYNYFSTLLKQDNNFLMFFNRQEFFKLVALENNDKETIGCIPFVENILNKPNMIKTYSELLGITEKELLNKIGDLLKINDEVLNTLCPFMLSPKMNCLSFKNIEKLSIYPDIQIKLSNLSQKELMVLNKILNYLDNDLTESFDITTIIYYIINNWNSHKDLITTIDVNNLKQEELANLIFVLQRKNDFYNIKTKEDLEPSNFAKLTDNVFREIDDKVLNGQIDIEELRRATLEKKFSIDIDVATFIKNRYCSYMDVINNSKTLSSRTKLLLQSIDYILAIDNIEELSFIYLTSTRLLDTYYSFIDLEAQIRHEYAESYSKSLYKVKEEHLMKQTDFEDSNLYNVVSEVSYNNQKPQFYVLDGDFNLQIHVLGAYRHWSRPNNFKEDWERPKIAYHGICTSYIGNNQIANARQSHPAYGFSGYEAEALISIQNSDIFSDRLINQFASSIYQPCMFLPPKEMIDKTRHTHNEFVLERRNGKGRDSFKRMPDYVVYFVDDINNSANFDMQKNTLFNETVQAAVDNGIPIVIVDRLKYAKNEKKKYEELLTKFENEPKPEDLVDILLIICNNMVGCAKYDSQPDMEYHKYFNEEVLTTVLDKIIEIIIRQPEDIKVSLITELYNYSNNEELIKDENKTKISNLYDGLNTLYKTTLENSNVVKEVVKYYSMASEEVKKAIITDLRNGLSYQMVQDKIANNEYRGMTKI